MPARSLAPGGRWRAFLVFTVLTGSASFAGQPPLSGRPPELAQVGLPNAGEAAELLGQFRNAGVPGEYYLEFQLQAMPRRGDTRVSLGRLWGGRNRQGAVTRVEVIDSSGGVHRFLLQNGPQAAIWRLVEGQPVKLDVAAAFEPIIPGVDLTAFDLQMPYLYWPDARLQSINRIRGRPAHAFLFRAPPAFSVTAGAPVDTVRAFLDTQYNALVQTELLDATGRPLRTLSLVSIKTVDQQTIPRTVDFRNDVTRDKTRFHVTAAALHLDLGPAPFEPAALADDIRPPADQVVRLD
ncbi:MAG: hypothetical protein WD941_02970 [Opitutus sp.]